MRDTRTPRVLRTGEAHWAWVRKRPLIGPRPWSVVLPSYRLGAHDLVIEMREVIDLGNEVSVEDEMHHLIRSSGVRHIIIDIHTAVVTAAAVRVVLRTRDAAWARGVGVRVVARHSLARRVFRTVGLHHLLRVTGVPP